MVVAPARTIALIGATSGLGRAAADRLAQDGHRLVLVGRDPARVERLATRLPTAVVIGADISTMSGIDLAATRIEDAVDHLDALVSNAGVMVRTRQTTGARIYRFPPAARHHAGALAALATLDGATRPPSRRRLAITPAWRRAANGANRWIRADGVELNFAVHCLAPYSMTSRLLPLLRAGSGRVVNVNSEGHRAPLFGGGRVTLDLDDLDMEVAYEPFLAYSRTKLANLLFSYELQRRHPELSVVAVHPGMVRSDLGRQWPRLQVAAMHAMSISARKGAEPVVALATAAAVERGAYYNRFTATRSSTESYDRDLASRLWDALVALRGPFDR